MSSSAGAGLWGGFTAIALAATCLHITEGRKLETDVQKALQMKLHIGVEGSIKSGYDDGYRGSGAHGGLKLTVNCQRCGTGKMTLVNSKLGDFVK